MGILKSLFGSNPAIRKKQETIAWNALTESKQLEEIIVNSSIKYQAIFKHSTRCGVSSGVLRQFERQENNGSIDFYFLDILSHRTISNEIATSYGIIHESPQLIVIKNGQVAAHGSHYDIMNLKLEDF